MLISLTTIAGRSRDEAQRRQMHAFSAGEAGSVSKECIVRKTPAIF